MEVRIQPLNQVIRVEPGANLLQTLQAAGIPMSYSCMAGRCGTCRCKVVAGEILESGREAQGPVGDHESYVLACRTFITESCTIQIPDPDDVVVHPARIIKATVVSLENLTHDVRRIVVKLAKPLQHSPGQYVQVQFTPQLVRPYSLTGLGGDLHMEFHVRLIPGGRVTGHVANKLSVGDVVRISGPLGCAYLRQKHLGPMLCIAGSTGLAPILSILRGAIAHGMVNPIHVYFGVRAEQDVYGLDCLEQLRRQHPALKVHVVVSSGPTRPAYRSGLVTEAIDADLSNLEGWRAYICGSPPMVEAAAFLVRKKGMAADFIHADAFYPQGT